MSGGAVVVTRHPGAMPLPLLGDLLDLVLPAGCAGCGVPGQQWCRVCAGTVGPSREVVDLPGVPPIIAVGVYAGPLRTALLAYKERGRRGLADPFAEMLARAVRRRAPERCWLVPAPSRPSAARARGGDHVRALADLVAERLAVPIAEQVVTAAGGSGIGVSTSLRMRAGVRDSVGLDPAAREANLRGRVLVRASDLPPPGAGVLLIDDVVTTGSTLRACAAALASVGVAVDGAVVLCDATGGAVRTRWSGPRM